ncbi:glycosyltransferase family 4 protein [Cryobacterium cryoconiti]|uniref:Glycosyltransferase n=1 Tax=Cryobacterium cryoconiti TaxID=1259239 RepID=A0A4Y8JWA3_9MICO|nr:glycosyltransferase family 4 protein [Cryobacterium cryoconiti]TFD31726.1 glycosyltransferase [Cryobacterium cryoconiti]
MTGTTDGTGERSVERVAWVSGAYGYNGELVYFQDIFAEFLRRFPNGIIPVAKDFPVGRYPGLALSPILAFHRLGRTRRNVGDITYIGVRRLPTAATWVRLIRLRADVFILIEFSPTSLVGFLIARATRRRIVLLIESDPSYRGAPSGRLSLAIKKFVAERVDAVLVSNEIGANFVRDTLRVSEAKTVVGPYLTSCPAPLTEGAPAERPPGVVRILFLNSLTARKGLAELIQALAAVAGARTRWVLDVVGTGIELEAIRRQVDALGLGDNVVFHGRVAYTGIGPFYSSADLVVCPTLADYRSLGGFEAVNAGKPVLVSCYDGAHQEILRYAPAARLIDPRDTASFTSVLEQFILDEPALEAARRAAGSPPEQFSMTSVGGNLQSAVLLALRTKTLIGAQR